MPIFAHMLRMAAHVLATFKSFFTNENVQVYHDVQPHNLTDVFGITYNQFTNPDGTTISFNGKEIEAKAFMELLNPAEGTEALAKYGKPWGVAILER